MHLLYQIGLFTCLWLTQYVGAEIDNYDENLVGTWSSKSETVLTGPVS